jgi:hypothetical protein
VILGGVHGGHEFHFAEETANAHFASLSGPLNPAEKWQSYFRTHDSFWNAELNVPRILAREVIGLQTFGYRPHLFNEQLSFGARQSDNAPSRPTSTRSSVPAAFSASYAC